ncbi:uncharacterized protein LOC128034075 [Gossypium raimondii]|uniref:uncharacterized protein LOC128034075 n=1 Tax=Gossypium raimondii TaxID=29730 RepID=UPI00227B6979|nr:uncharacterized protein LOC128034075 [Gossypium raimondii]
MEEKRNLGPELVQEVEDKVGDKVYLKVSPWKKVLRFGRKERIHDIFHVSMLRKYKSDPSHVVPAKEIEVRSDILYEDESIAILDREVKVLRNKTAPLMKFLWRNHKIEEAT